MCGDPSRPPARSVCSGNHVGLIMRAALRVSDTSEDVARLELMDHHRHLMARIAAERDRAAFEELFLHFGPRVKALMLNAGADAALAEDLVQDVMMTVWKKVDLYVAERGTVSSWIFTIARNARIDRLRRGVSRPYEDVESLELAADESDGEDHAITNQRAERVADALLNLPDEQREIIELAYIKDIPQSAIAEKLDLPLGTVKSRMRLAYAKLRGDLEDLK